MSMYNNNDHIKNGKITLNQFFILFVAFWPFFWDVWRNTKLVSFFGGIWVPLIVLGAFCLCLFLIKVSFKWVLALPWVFFVCASFFSGMRAYKTEFAINMFVLLCGVLFVLAARDEPQRWKSMFHVLLFCALIVTACMIIDLITGVFSSSLLRIYTQSAQEYKLQNSIPCGLLVSSGSVGGVVVCGMVSVFVQHAASGRKRPRIQDVVFFAFFVYIMIAIRKRGFIIDIAGALIVLWFFNRAFHPEEKKRLIRGLRWFVRVALIAAVLLIIYNKVVFFQNAVNLFLERFTRGDTTLSGRTQLYRLAWELFKTHPLTGIGWGRYRLNTVGIFSRYSTTTYDTHNIYLQLLCETGIIGLFAFLLAAGMMLILAVRQYRYHIMEKADACTLAFDQAALFMQLFLLFYGISGNPLYDYDFLMMYFFAVALGVRSLSNLSTGFWWRGMRKVAQV